MRFSVQASLRLFSKKSKITKFSENFKNFKFALISETLEIKRNGRKFGTPTLSVITTHFFGRFQKIQTFPKKSKFTKI